MCHDSKAYGFTKSWHFKWVYTIQLARTAHSGWKFSKMSHYFLHAEMRLLEGFLNTVDLKLAWIRSWVHIAEFQRRISLYLILLLKAVNSETVPRAAKKVQKKVRWWQVLLGSRDFVLFSSHHDFCKGFPWTSSSITYSTKNSQDSATTTPSRAIEVKKIYRHFLVVLATHFHSKLY